MTQIHAYADIPNGYNGRWVRVGFALIGRRPICIHNNGTWHYCAFIVDVADKDELLYCINPDNGLYYSDYIRDFDSGTDKWGYKGKGISQQTGD